MGVGNTCQTEHRAEKQKTSPGNVTLETEPAPVYPAAAGVLHLLRLEGPDTIKFLDRQCFPEAQLWPVNSFLSTVTIKALILKNAFKRLTEIICINLASFIFLNPYSSL